MSKYSYRYFTEMPGMTFTGDVHLAFFNVFVILASGRIAERGYSAAPPQP